MTHPLTEEDLAVLEALVRAKGPTRVLTDKDGTALSPIRAARLGVIPELVLVRADGWTLGTPVWLEATARKLWAGSWVHEFTLTH